MAARTHDQNLEANGQVVPVRVFETPKEINLEATNFLELLPESAWERMEWTHPPILRDCTDNQIQETVTKCVPFTFPQVQCHS